MSKHEPPTNWYIIGSQTSIKSIKTDEYQIRADWPLISGRSLLISVISTCFLLYSFYLAVFALRNQAETSAAQQQAHQYLHAISRSDFASALQHCQRAQDISQHIAQWGGSDINEIRFEPLERSLPSIGTVRAFQIYFTAHPTQGTPPQQGAIVMSWLFPDFTWWAIPGSKNCAAFIAEPPQMHQHSKPD